MNEDFAYKLVADRVFATVKDFYECIPSQGVHVVMDQYWTCWRIVKEDTYVQENDTYFPINTTAYFKVSKDLMHFGRRRYEASRDPLA